METIFGISLGAFTTFFLKSKMLYEWDVLISFYMVSNLCSVWPSLFTSMGLIKSD